MLETDAQVVAFIGENGSGKSTLLKAVTGAYPQIDGHIEVAGVTFHRSASDIYLPIESRDVGYVPQGNSLMPHLTALENICFGPIPKHLDQLSYTQAGMDWLTTLGSADIAQMSASALSTGQCQRVALARILVRQPKALLLDEPLSNIDPVTRLELRRSLRVHLSENKTPTLIVTHDYREVLNIAQLVCVMDAGKVIQIDTPKAVATQPVNAFAEAFFEGSLVHTS